MITWPRTVIHVDMDAFFAAVEQRDRPELRGQPVIIGGRSEDRGVVSTASYEARKYGVHSAMPTARALRLCPQGILLPADHKKYQAVSEQIHEVFSRHSDQIEPLSLDEAFIDVSGRDSVAIAVAIKRDILDETRLTASVGLSYNKFLAKLASDMNKPDGFTFLTPAKVAKILPGLPVTDLPGIGPRTAEQLARHGITLVVHIKTCPVGLLQRLLGARAESVRDLAHGIDERPVVTDREPRSFSEETTFAEDTTDGVLFDTTLGAFAHDLSSRLAGARLLAGSVTVKCRYSDFKLATRTRSCIPPTADPETLHALARSLLSRFGPTRPLRLIGLQVGRLQSTPEHDQSRLPV